MSSEPLQNGTSTETETAESDLRAEVELLEEENRRLREQYVHARRITYRRSALGLGVIGSIAALGAVVFPAAQTVLFALAGIGLFAAVLTYYLTPERFIAADVGERIYTAVMDNETALVDELSLSQNRLYVPHETETVRLFVPQHADYDLPADEALQATIVITDNEYERGLALTPTGRELFSEFEETTSGPVGSTPQELSTQLTDALTNVFELVETATAEVDREEGRLTVAVSNSAYQLADDVDHPVASFLAVGLTVGLETPIETEVTSDPSDDTDAFQVTCRWDVESSH
ncbi:hypothetical protein SAMN04487948_13717 [Halogranum amylolyticum]|uniref:DUF7982 domain-containing protein n=1 Tax=Halogranum amylolyticum TaxID=660520 RepID=A0A1H8WQQ4_9EURY|nr:hypothetical protein [Halogranum amylolyticum]SEP29833.1 hypothetical protein SAMN04487948_13717 [Halogranum amylolyticum]